MYKSLYLMTGLKLKNAKKLKKKLPPRYSIFSGDHGLLVLYYFVLLLKFPHLITTFMLLMVHHMVFGFTMLFWSPDWKSATSVFEFVGWLVSSLACHTKLKKCPTSFFYKNLPLKIFWIFTIVNISKIWRKKITTKI